MDAGKVIKKLRQEKGLTQQQFAEMLQISKASVQKYEQGDVTNLKAETLKKLCLLLNVSPWLFVFPERVNMEKENITEVYKWTEIFKIMTIYTDLSESNKNRVNEYVEVLHAVEKISIKRNETT